MLSHVLHSLYQPCLSHLDLPGSVSILWDWDFKHSLLCLFLLTIDKHRDSFHASMAL